MLQRLRMNNKKGFTLIELMIVIAIIGILAAIAVPQFLAYRVRSYNAAAKAVAHNLKADQGNLNSELGVYGHTEAGALALTAADAGPGEADTFTVPALVIPATAGAAGARLAGTHPVTGRMMAIGTAVGSSMVANAVEELVNADSHVVHTRHYKGDTAYALDSDVENALYTVSNPNWPNNAALQATAVAATTSTDDFDAVAGGGLPTANWMMSE